MALSLILRASIVAAAGSLLLPTVPMYAQTSFREHSVGLGTRLSLPSSWVLDSEEQLVQLREHSLQSLRASNAQQLRELAAANENAIMFRAHDPALPANSANMNVTVVPAITPRAYGSLTSAELSSIVAAVCEPFLTQVREAGGTGGCTGHELVTLENRKVLVINQHATIERAGLDNRRTVALFPADGLLFTLSISLRKEDYDPALPRTILASVRLLTE